MAMFQLHNSCTYVYKQSQLTTTNGDLVKMWKETAITRLMILIQILPRIDSYQKFIIITLGLSQKKNLPAVMKHENVVTDDNYTTPIQHIHFHIQHQVLVLHFFFTALCQFTLLLNLRCLIFGLTPSSWLRTWTLIVRISRRRTKLGRQRAHCKLRQSPCARLLLTNHMVYLHLFGFFLFYLQMPRQHTQIVN
jgi:hypothetical protein